MHFTQTFAGAALIAGALHLGVSNVLPDPPAPPLVVINSLSYSDGVVIQDRAINATDRQWIIWEAAVVSDMTGQPVPGCSGAGFWEYSPGERVARIPLREWVGNANCQLIDGAKYQLFSRYKIGGWGTDARSEVFVK